MVPSGVPSGVKACEHVQEHAATGAAVERPGAFDLLLGAGQIDLGGVRDHQDDRLGGDPGAGGR